MAKQIVYTILAILLGFAIGALVYLFYPDQSMNQDLSKVKVFFSNKYEDPDASFCDKVYFAERYVEKDGDLPEQALKELLKGPNRAEKKGGFFTSINRGTKLQKLEIKDGIAQADFNQKLQEKIAGSCQVSAIRAQIDQTLRQFPAINKVVISINGDSEGILQP